MAFDTAMTSGKEYNEMGIKRPILFRLVERFKKGMAARAAENELLQMDDRTLADIGLSRGDVPRAVRTNYNHKYSMRGV